MTMIVRLDATGGASGTATLRVVGPEGLSGEGTFSVPCQATEERFVTITTTALPNVVKAYTPAGLTWSVKCPGDSTFRPIGSTSHRIYVTYGTPSGSSPTNRRMNFVCNAAAQAGTVLEVIDGVDPGGFGIHENLNADPPQDSCPQGNKDCVDNWRLMSSWPYRGECDEQARFMNLVIQIIGAGNGSVYETYASTDSQVTSIETTTALALGITVDLDGDGIAGEANEILELIFDFDPDPTRPRNWNLFEGSISAAGRFYAVWPSFSADSQVELLCTVISGLGAKQRWVYRIVDPVTGAWDVTYEHPGDVSAPSCSP